MQQYEFDQIITPDNITVTLNDYRKYFSWGFRGRGIPPAAHRTERGPFQHGDTLLGYVLRPRTMSLVVRRNECSRQEYWDARDEFLDTLRPNRHGETFDMLTLRKILPDRSMRDIRAIIDAGPEFIEEDEDRWDEFSFQEVLRFVAYDPIFYDPQEIFISYSPSSDDELAFPLTFPIKFSPAGSTESFYITNIGTWESFPEFVLVGPMKDPVIRNITTNENIKLVYTIPAGKSVTISLAYGNKYVEDSIGNNLIGSITSDSDFASFSLAVHPLATNGVNSIGFSAYDMSANSEVIMRYYTRYIGI